MKKEYIWILILAALAIGGFVWAYDERSKRLLAEQNLSKKETDYLKLLTQYLEKTGKLPDEIKSQLIHLREKYAGISDEIAIELKTIIELVEDKKDEIAIEKLMKVIENILKEEFVKYGEAKDKRSCPKLFKMLQRALELKWITKHEYEILVVLKDNRNEEAHELAVKFPLNWKYIAFLAGIELLHKFRGIERKHF